MSLEKMRYRVRSVKRAWRLLVVSCISLSLEQLHADLAFVMHPTGYDSKGLPCGEATVIPRS